MLAAASAAIALAAADTYVVVLALTDMMAGVGLGIESIQRATPIISGFLLGYIAVLPLIGRLADLLDRPRILLGCLIIFVCSSAVTALAVELPVLVVGRFFQGVGGGGLVPATLALVADLWVVGRRGTPLGVVSAVQELGSVLGPVLGAAILAWWDWRGIFWINAMAGVVLYAVIRVLSRSGNRVDVSGGADVIAGVAVVGPGEVDVKVSALAWSDRARRPNTYRLTLLRWLARLLALLGTAGVMLALWAPRALTTSVAWGAPFVPLGTATSRLVTPIGLAAMTLLLAAALAAAPRWYPVLRRADLLGAALIAVALGSLILTFASANPETEVIGPLGMRLLPVGAIAVLLAWWWHRRAAVPLIGRGIVHGRAAGALACSLLVGAALVAIVVDVPLLARLTLTESMTDAALVLVRFLIALPVGALLGGLALRRMGPAVIAAAGLVLAGGGLIWMSTWDRGSLADLLPTTAALLAAGLGLGLALAPVNAAALAAARPDEHGVMSSLLVVARMIGMVVGLALLTAVGLHRYYQTAHALVHPTADQLLDAGVVQVQTVFAGGAVAAFAAAALALTLGFRRD